MPPEFPAESTGDPRHLSQIHTDPAVIRWLTASSDLGEDVVDATRKRFFERYADPVYAFVRRLLRDPEATDEVVQRFAVRVLEQTFRGYSPERGRFRDYLKTVLRRMVTDHWRATQRTRRFAGQSVEDLVSEIPEPRELDTALTPREGELEALLERTFARLRAVKQSTRPSWFEVLDYVARHPGKSSDEAAASLSLTLGLQPPLSAVAFRQALCRARERFRELLIEELRADGHGGEGAVEEQLAELGIARFFTRR